MTAPGIDVVIVDYNAGDALRDCVASLAAAAPETDRVHSVTIVDNVSDPPTTSVLAGAAESVRIIRNTSNRGFAAACNQGAREGIAPYLLFLNPDTAVTAPALEVPAEFLDRAENATVGIVGIQLRDVAGQPTTSCYAFPRPAHFWNKALGLDRLAPGYFANGAQTGCDHRSTRDVDQVMGAFFLVRRALFEKLGGFDERFFVYFEEMDFSKRAASAGFRTVFLAEANALHVGEGTTAAIKARRLFYSWRSRLRYADKHFSRLSAASVGLVTFAVEPLTRLAMAAFPGSTASPAEILRAWAMLLRDSLRPAP